jgi:hypothetical protein
MRKNRLLSLAACAAIAVFVLTFIELFQARVQSGDIYPVYSSLRSDAGGTKAYYESIAKLGGLQVARGFEPLQANRRRGVTVFLLGVSPQAMTAEGAKYQKLAAEGNRLVIGMPVCSADQAAKPASAGKLWELGWECVKRTPAPDYYVLTEVGRQWRVLAWDEDGTPIAAEHTVGKGSLVLVTDTYALTNEALLRARDTELLAGLLGPHRRILFDEHHLGVVESQGVVSLARQYRLHGFAAGLLLLAVLFIWRNSSSFLPRIGEEISADEVAGRAATSGLTNLLGRAISKSELVKVCVSEWRRSQGRRAPEDQVARITDIAANTGAAKEPVASYREIAQVVNERRRR